jgi:hypothetical protein
LKLAISTLALTMTLAGCGGDSSSPTQASATTTPASLSGATSWMVTQRFGSVSGPDNCWIREQRQRWSGAVFSQLPATITHSGKSVTVDSDWFQVNYTGTSSGSEFTATGRQPLEGARRTCADGSSFEQLAGVSKLTGRFAGDAQGLTATETNTYQLTTGETVTYVWDWEARRY